MERMLRAVWEVSPESTILVITFTLPPESTRRESEMYLETRAAVWIWYVLLGPYQKTYEGCLRQFLM